MWSLHLTNLIIHGYYYRYREQRKQIKQNLVDTGNYTEARTKLNETITEYNTKYPDSDTKKDFNYGEKLMLNHAKRHIDTVIDQNDPSFQEVDENLIIITIKHQSDMVKEALLQTPKMDYT